MAILLKNKKRNFDRRKGILLVEIIVASTVLIAIMIFVTTICLRIRSTWKDVREQRTVVAELSSQLDGLTILSEEELTKAIKSLEVSEAIQNSLNANLSGRVYDDSIGKCVELTMTWKKAGLPDRQVSVSAWHLGSSFAEATDD